eukprot:g4318.t1
MSKARVGVDSVLDSVQGVAAGVAAQKEADDLTSLRREFERLILERIRWSVVLIALAYAPLLCLSALAAIWLDMFDSGGQYWYYTFLSAAWLLVLRTPRLCFCYCRRSGCRRDKVGCTGWKKCFCRQRACLGCGPLKCWQTKVPEKDDMRKRGVLLNWALTVVGGLALMYGGIKQLQLVSQCEGPYPGVLLNQAQMRLWNLTLEKLVYGDERACHASRQRERQVACEPSTSPCADRGEWESAYVCGFCETHGSRPCLARRRGINVMPGVSPFCFEPTPLILNTATAWIALTFSVFTIVLAARRFVQTWNIRVIKYDLKALAIAPYPPPPPIPQDLLQDIENVERRKAGLGKPRWGRGYRKARII